MAVADLSHGDHCCLLFGSEQSQLEVTVPFLIAGLERDERSLYVGSPQSIEQIREGLKSAGVAVNRDIARGRLVLDSGHDYLDQGEWVTDRMLGFLQQAYDSTLAEGYTALRAAGDVSWQVGPRQDFRDVVYYEALLDVFFLGKRMVGMCQYPRERCPPEVLSGIMATHRTALLDRELYQNFHYAPELLFEKDQQAREAKRVEWMTSQLRRVRQAESERSRLEAQLHHAQKMDAIGRLAGGVAHDFNNMLTVILGNCELVADDPNPSVELIRESLDDIQDVANRASALTRQLLAFSRRKPVEVATLDLNRVVGEADRLLRRLIGEDVELVSRLAPGLDPVRIDAGQLEQVIVNLAVNARDAMPQGGKLTIETANLELDEVYAREHAGVRPGFYVMLAVSDNGSGMSPEVLARIFEPFFTTKGLNQGTGLGLATVYGIVKQAGGDVWVYSEPGQGTSFKVYLPRSTEVSAPRAEEPIPVPAVKPGATILVIEDEPALRRLLRRILEGGGYRVLDAANGDQAVALCTQQGAIDLVLSDVVLPGLNGSELARQLGAARPGIRIAYMSGYTDDVVARHGLLEPGSAFIEKPIRPAQLLRKIGELLS